MRMQNKLLIFTLFFGLSINPIIGLSQSINIEDSIKGLILKSDLNKFNNIDSAFDIYIEYCSIIFNESKAKILLDALNLDEKHTDHSSLIELQKVFTEEFYDEIYWEVVFARHFNFAQLLIRHKELLYPKTHSHSQCECGKCN